MRKVFIVEGSTGEYSDHTEWPVAAYFSEALAAQRVLDCERGAKEALVRKDRYHIKPGDNPYDFSMYVDYTGVSYTFYAVDLVDG